MAQAVAKAEHALVVGGLPSFFENTLQGKLLEFGIKSEWHWQIDKPIQGDIPEGCDLIVVFVDITADGADIVNKLKDKATPRGIQVVSTQRKLAPMVRDLERRGFTHRRVPDVSTIPPPSAPIAHRPYRLDHVTQPLRPPSDKPPPPTPKLDPVPPPPEPEPTPAPVQLVPPREQRLTPEWWETITLPDSWDSQMKLLKRLLTHMKKSGLDSLMLTGTKFEFRRAVVEDGSDSL